MTHTAYLFPGQGSQTVGMGQTLAEAYAIARDTFAEADAILGFALSALCFEGPAETLTETHNAQPALLTTSIAALRALQTARPDLPPPCCVAGHSLGEYSALVATGALSFADAVRLTHVRGELMAQAGAAHPGGMAAILRLEDDQVAVLCAQAAAESGDVVQPANYNAPGQVVISGGPAGIAAAVALAKAVGGRAIPLAVSIAAHSALMAPITANFAAHLAATPFTTPRFPVIGNVQAAPLATAAEIRQELVAQLTAPVCWTASVAYMAQAGATRFIEIGPGNVLTGLVKRIDGNVKTANVATAEEIEAFTSNEYT
ncbi:MAG: [acyl-carrier-protein] S-malonyltransferase [Chloroflexi bacterium HGW-Chloroflexi-1]|nr:MAG: [acyl-carrier-protein] S-malonyltransferase [Chloroflexi bacterium HGW-Chloroflexi-1]